MTSPSLDRTVAEKIMDLHIVQNAGLTPCKCWKEHIIAPRAYSTSIADAWLVVAEMERRGFEWCMERLDNGNCAVRFYPNDEAEAETLPIAICLASLKAVGGTA